MHISSFTLLIIAAVVVIALLIVAGLLKAKFGGLASSAAAPAVYELRKSVFTPAERSFAGVLDGALPDGVTWFAKVRLGDVFKTKKGLSPSQRKKSASSVTRLSTNFTARARCRFFTCPRRPPTISPSCERRLPACWERPQ
jgi:hypothetical protein